MSRSLHPSIKPAIAAIACLLRSKEPFLLTRVGLGDETSFGYCHAFPADPACESVGKSKKYSTASSALAPSNSGVYGDSRWLIEGYGKMYYDAISAAEVHARFNHLENHLEFSRIYTANAGLCKKNHHCEQDSMLQKAAFRTKTQFARFKTRRGKEVAEACDAASIVHHRSLEPWMYARPMSESWTAALAGRRVLLVTPFVSTIRKQLARCEKVWGSHNAAYLCPRGMEVVFVKSPYTFLTNRSVPWTTHLADLKSRVAALMEGSGFDAAFLGCGGFGLPLAHFIRAGLNRTAIYVGGGLQLWFGILGGRWNRNPYIRPHMNVHWTRPFKSETPETRIAASIESSTYWR